MSKSIIIKRSKIILKAFKVIYWISFLLFLAVVISWFFNRNLWDQVEITAGFKAGVGISGIQFSAVKLAPNAIILNEISPSMMIWLLLRNSLFFLLGLLILQEIGKILKSIESIEVFYSSNIESFKKIGKLCFIIAGLAFFNFYLGEPGSTIDFTIPFKPILFGFASFLLAEVFREGKALTDDKKSII